MKSIIAWFVNNPVGTNLLMWIFLIAGGLSFLSLNQEEFPNVDMGTIQITVPYLGASPQEVEQAVCLRIEEALQSTQNIDQMNSRASEGMCSVTLQIEQGAELNRVLNEVKSQVDGISTFPEETEQPVVAALSPTAHVISLALVGNADDFALKGIAEKIREDLIDIDGISQVEVSYLRPFEISIEVPELTLRQYDLSLEQVANAIRQSSLDMPGGTLKTESGEILLRSLGQAYRGEEYGNIIIRSMPDGSELRLRDIANVQDGFQEGYLNAQLNGRNAALIQVFKVGEEDIVRSATAVKRYLKNRRATLPQGLELIVESDSAKSLQERIEVVADNAYSGLVLVLILLALFLRFRLAIWVAAGIPIAIFGAMMFFPSLGITFSTMTIMAFILVLGILVDDAIVVGERVHAHEAMGKSQTQAAIDGTLEVSTPVVFGVLTTIAAFLPLLLLEGPMGGFFGVIGAVVVLCLIASLIEAQLILPCHLAHRKTSGYWLEGSALVTRWQTLQAGIASALERFADSVYRKYLCVVVEHRYATWATATAVILLTLTLVASGRVIFQFLPAVEGDVIYASVQMPEGVAAEVTESAVAQLERAAIELREELHTALRAAKADGDADQDTLSPVKHILSVIGQPVSRNNGPVRASAGGSHIGEVAMSLNPYLERGEISSNTIRDRWREKVGHIPDALEVNFTADSFSAGDSLNFRLEGRNEENLKRAANELKAELNKFPGVYDVSDSFREGKQEAQITLREEGRFLGLTLNDVARQVRQAFYGAEAQRIQRGRDDIRVMVRYPEDERQSLGNLEDLLIRTPDGSEVPFSSVAKMSLGNGYSSINRRDGRRIITVRGDVDRSLVTPEEIQSTVRAKFAEKWRRDYQVNVALGGEGEQRMRSMAGIFTTFPLAMIIIFALLAIPLKSYLQPLIIMSVIPFGAIGAIFGHFLMGAELVFFSLLGIIALSGVVVNASLVLVVYINRQVDEGMSLRDAVLSAGVARFRPIFLTSITTFMGLIPLMLTASPATSFIVPMAISLAFGVLFATIITLFLVPALFMILHDFVVHRTHRDATALEGSAG
ncbi:efflux RND transporter permease subunit [Proteobacteria bacterium 005FR1]|nr:efflux RND transporter permease subunit [Proteobacteria bacterium 005FR1]